MLFRSIRLKERVENRMVIADATATGDDNPLNHESNDLSYRKEQLRRLQEEVIEMEDLKTGVSITDLGLNDFRMDLLNYVKAHGDLEGLPSGMHAVVPAAPDRGLPPGAIFALRNRNQGVNLIIMGAVVCFLSFLLTITSSFSHGSFPYVLYGLTSCGILIAFAGFTKVF